MRRGVLAALVAALFAVGAVPASAATHTDPTGDNCATNPGGVAGTFCSFDITSAADTTDANGTVHLKITYTAHECTKDGTVIFHSVPAFEFYDTSVSAPAAFGLHMRAILQSGLHGSLLRDFPSPALT